GKDSAVAADVVAATGFPYALGCGGWTVDAEQGSAGRSWVAENRQRQVLALGGAQSQLAGEQLALDLCVDHGAERKRISRGQIRFRRNDQCGVDAIVRANLVRTVEGAEEPEAILDEIAAAIETVVKL